MPANNASVPAIIKLAVKPAPTLANPAANPARGCRPIAWKTMAATGGIIIIAASEAMLPSIPAKTTAYVTSDFGAFKIVVFMNVSNSPAFWAKPIPSIIVITSPKGANPVKLLSIDERM